jgi:hypothetical protein
MEKGRKMKVIKGNTLIESGTVVTIDGDKKGNLHIGKTGMVFCNMPTGGGLYFEESNLEPA